MFTTLGLTFKNLISESCDYNHCHTGLSCFRKKCFGQMLQLNTKQLCFALIRKKNNRSREQSEEFRDQFFQIREKRVILTGECIPHSTAEG
jgi:hypothetical protein